MAEGAQLLDCGKPLPHRMCSFSSLPEQPCPLQAMLLRSYAVADDCPCLLVVLGRVGCRLGDVREMSRLISNVLGGCGSGMMPP